MERLIEEATRMGSNAVVGADFETSGILRGTTVIVRLIEKEG